MTSPETLAAILLWLAALLAVARAGGWLAEVARQPAVLGELLAGIAAGALLTVDKRAEPALTLLAELGVIFLLFEVGLESRDADVRVSVSNSFGYGGHNASIVLTRVQE